MNVIEPEGSHPVGAPDTGAKTWPESAPRAGMRGAKALTWKRTGLKALWLFLYPLAFLVSDAMSRDPAFVETFYSQGIYPAVSTAVGAVFSVFPFSFAEFLLYFLVTALIVFIIVCIVRAVRRTLPLQRFISWLLTVLIIGGAGLNAFYWMWGFNYYRYSLADRMGLEKRESGTEELAALCFSLSAAANDLRGQVAQDEEGIFMYEEGNTGILSHIPAAYEKLGEHMELFSRPVYQPKPVLASEALSYAGIAGIFIPFTEEANVNVDNPPLCVASSGAHETAHFLGIAREEEANFAAYLACIYSEEPQIQYSGVMMALIHAGNALSSTDAALYSELWQSYDDAVARDLRSYNSYLAAHEGEVSERSREMNDNYLRSHGQSSGVKSYGEMVDLLLAYYRPEPAE